MTPTTPQKPKPKLLVVEAHSDDSCISVGGFLEKFRHQYDYHFCLAVSSDFKLHHSGTVSRNQRMEEYEGYVQSFGGVWHHEAPLPFDADATLDRIPKKDIVAAIERVIQKVQPSVLICQGPSFHHDHTLTYEATIAATRPTSVHCPAEIYIMENPTYVHSLGPQTDFKPDTYISLTEEQLEHKIQLFQKYFPSQVRTGRNYLSPEGLRSWARYRGIEGRCDYAEGLRTYIRVK